MPDNIRERRHIYNIRYADIIYKVCRISRFQKSGCFRIGLLDVANAMESEIVALAGDKEEIGCKQNELNQIKLLRLLAHLL